MVRELKSEGVKRYSRENTQRNRTASSHTLTASNLSRLTEPNKVFSCLYLGSPGPEGTTYVKEKISQSKKWCDLVSVELDQMLCASRRQRCSKRLPSIALTLKGDWEPYGQEQEVLWDLMVRQAH